MSKRGINPILVYYRPCFRYRRLNTVDLMDIFNISTTDLEDKFFCVAYHVVGRCMLHFHISCFRDHFILYGNLQYLPKILLHFLDMLTPQHLYLAPNSRLAYFFEVAPFSTFELLSIVRHSVYWLSLTLPLYQPFLVCHILCNSLIGPFPVFFPPFSLLAHLDFCTLWFYCLHQLHPYLLALLLLQYLPFPFFAPLHGQVTVPSALVLKPLQGYFLHSFPVA